MASRARRFARIKRRTENMTTFLRLGLVVAGGYLLWRRFERDQIEEAELANRLAQQQAGSPSAMLPLVEPTADALPAPHAVEVAYSPASDDQLDTTRQLATPEVQDLDPGALARAALNKGTTWLQSTLAS